MQGPAKPIKVPFDKGNPRVIAQTVQALTSTILQRSQIASKLGLSFGTDRDVYEALGYKKQPTYSDFYARYRRQDVAKRVIEAPVRATWREKPEIREVGNTSGKETNFEKEWQVLEREKKIFHYLERADKIASVGQYGIILCGFDDISDEREMDQPVGSAGAGVKQLLYLRPYAENHAEIQTFDENVRSERYGMPELYQVRYTDTANRQKQNSVIVHHSRIIHLAEDLFEDEIYGAPRLEIILNRLFDLDLVCGGSAEMLWRGGFPGLVLKNREGADFGQGQDLEALEDELQEYVHHLRRYLRLQNMDADQLTSEVKSPKDHLDLQISMISAATGIPKRILMGSERGELSSGQDKENWADRVDERKNGYAENGILRPVIDKLINFKVLPPPGKEGYEVAWPDSHNETEKEQAAVDEVKVRTAATYVNANGMDMLIPPSVFLERYMGFTPDEVEGALKLVDDAILEEKKEIIRSRNAATAGGDEE